LHHANRNTVVYGEPLSGLSRPAQCQGEVRLQYGGSTAGANRRAPINRHDVCLVDVAGELAGFRRELHRCVTARADALFELTDALLCTDGPVKSLVGLSLAPEHRRGRRAMYDALIRAGSMCSGCGPRWSGSRLLVLLMAG
jgi:hypothetical protein